MPSPPPIESIIGQLASSLGPEVAREVVERHARALGLLNLSTREEAARVLGAIDAGGGTAGLAARLLITRIERSAVSSSSSSGLFSAPPASAKRVKVSALADAMARSLGDAKANEVVAKACGALGYTADSLTEEQAARVLESLVKLGGVIGTVARFAKVRFLLDKEA